MGQRPGALALDLSNRAEDRPMSQCCYLDPNDPSVGCDRPARWVIQPAGLPGDRRQACELHAAAVLEPGRIHLILPCRERWVRCLQCGSLTRVSHRTRQAHCAQCAGTADIADHAGEEA
jgi:hypothetical protein